MKHFALRFILVCSFVGVFAEELYIPKYLKNKYGSNFSPKPSHGGVKTFTKTKTKTSYGSSAIKSTSKYIGGCNSEPPSPMNAGVRCSTFSGCRATCMPNYQFPNRETQLFITCNDGEWQVQGTEWNNIPSCEPICLPSCENNGICVAPNQCNCPENFSGPQCQFENKPCLNYPPMPQNAKRMCRPTSCTVTCMDGHQFPDGSRITTMTCKNGNWVPSRENWVSVPDCEATCNPPCQNGGNCLSFNVCQCPQDFRGPQCQYSADSCNARKLQFNGGYNCSGTGDMFSCSVSCPEGIQFEYVPAPVYTCTYATGMFLPTPIPQCMFASNTEVIPTGSAYTFFNPNGSFSLGNMLINNKPFLGNVGVGGMGHPYYLPNQKFQPNELTPELNDSNVFHIPIGQYENVENQYLTVEEKLPEPGTCFTWGGTHFKTFDGKVFSFDSKCAHTMVRDSVDNTFSIIVQNSPECSKNPPFCYRMIKIYFQSKEFVLKQSDSGIPIFVSGKKVLPIPGQLPGIRTEISAHYIVISIDSVGTTLKWDGRQLVQIEVKENLWNRTSGLCGVIDGDSTNDMMANDGTFPKSVVTLASSWQVDSFEDKCNAVPLEEHACQDTGIKGSKAKKALKFCKKILADKRFAECHSVMDTSVLLDSCRWDYCSCQLADPSECACDTLNVYVRECSHKGVKNLAKWRDENTCPMKCTGGRVYMTCAPKDGQEVCGASVENSEVKETCEEGCYCPKGTVLHDGKCITKDKCPCRLRGKDFAPGASVPKDCNTCTCSDGKWVCTQVACGARCSALGDPHYITFDGKRYDFMGQCSYYLVKADNFTIEAENVACAGTISLAMNFPISVSSGLPSCTKTVTIKMAGQSIKLKQNHEISINGKEITKIPYKIAGINIRSVSSIFLIVELPNGLEVWWDGLTRAYINVPASFKGQTKGLCGTFNDNQKDDFLTPENDIEKSVIPFANKWKTQEKCNDIPDKLKSHPCDTNIQNRATAELYCKKIKSSIFGDCHWHVDPEAFYQDCLYDMCSCEGKMSVCLCPMIAAYAHECALKGVRIDWRNDIKECGVHCPGGQKYQVCGNSCTRTCYDVATKPSCKEQCVEGCNCLEGEALDLHGECIPIGQCTCQHDGLEFQAGYKEVRPASKGLELCTCTNALWSCRLASSEEIKKYPKASDLKSMCDTSKNFVFTTCESPEPVTCKNMHSQELFSAEICHAGCECKEGYVLDSSSKTCVRPSDCPCHHGGKSYSEKSVVQSDCNTCTCKKGKWECTDRQCSAECSAWGDSHFKTFDGKMYDYQGQCDYVLSKGVLSTEDTFDISIQNVPCGSLGVSCSKSVTIKVGSGSQQESITLTAHKKVRDVQIFKRFTVRNRDLFVIIEAADIGLIIHWDKGTRVYVKVDPRWKTKVKGLCGNYNDNELDDFETPSGGITEVSPQLFGDSWKLQSYCPDAIEITDTCEKRPDRRVWALKQCGTLKTSAFSACHSEVPVEVYFEKCVFDSCACDQGGDCECLCTAIAAYAQECNSKGVPIKWRSQDLCPIQCDERCSHYSPCVSTCPLETCDNLLVQSPLSKLCKEDSCVEGCEPKPCPADHVYLNTSFTECVPRNICKPVCLEVDGVTYYEGDLMKEDDCHSCYCSRGKETCKGQPCPTTEEVTSTPGPVTHQLDKYTTCKSGWTDWINQDKGSFTKTKKAKKLSDIEPLPNNIVMNNLQGSSRCDVKDIVDIECRTVGDHIASKVTGMDVECSLEKGLICKTGSQSCTDFEIRVLCKCEEAVTEPAPLEMKYSPCNIKKPHQKHPTDCHLFYHCVLGTDGPELVEKTCGPTMMYNPLTQVCDWPNTVVGIRPDCEIVVKEIAPTVEAYKPTSTQSVEIIEVEDYQRCPPGEVYNDCAIQCDKLCMYYSYAVKQKGKCIGDNKCQAGCVSALKETSCPPGLFWANEKTCVAVYDCMCRSSDGKPVKPGTTYKESKCKICQCINNFYSCDTSACEEEEKEESRILEETETETHLLVSSTITPPKECSKDMFIDLIQGDQPLPDNAFSASSIQNEAFEAKYARLNSKPTAKSGGSWKPEVSDKNQYLQINLGRQEPIYGVIVKGSPIYTEYVTSYKVSYSPDGLDNYNFILNSDATKSEVFRGSTDTNTPTQQLFDVPIEAQIIRIHPYTWHNDIALKVELIGCKETITTLIPELAATIRPVLCDEPMGLETGILPIEQISVSSSLSRNNNKKKLKLNSDSAWQPITNSPTEWIQFDFLEPHNITGVETKGGPTGWVTTYNIKYSLDGQDWNSVMKDENSEKAFPGNFDQDTPYVNNFDLPIRAQYVKIVPLTWHDNIQIRVEPHGCFEPYPVSYKKKFKPIDEDDETNLCNDCPGVTSVKFETEECRCSSDLWWDGENCVSRIQCPCMVGHIPYAVGTVFEKEDCSECLCKLGGVSHCTPKLCEKCDKGLRSVTTSTCGCLCLPCEENKILCPTSNICINATQWCDGIQDCPDDEKNCLSTLSSIGLTIKPTEPTVIEEKVEEKKCPRLTCPPGYKVVKKKESKTQKYQRYLATMFSTYGRKTKSKNSYLGMKTGTKGGVKGGTKKRLGKPTKIKEEKVVQKEEECPQLQCEVSRPPPEFRKPGESLPPCPPVICPPGSTPEFDFTKSSGYCPSYECRFPPPPDTICNITGRTFNTFDNTEYKYDICNHILARDLENEEWDVSLKKKCDKTCSRNLIINHQDHSFVLFPDLTVEYDGFKYTVTQTKKIGSQSQAFSISRLGETLLFVSNRYGFWVIWDKQGNAKVGVSVKLVGKVDGLCGYYNDNPRDDKRKPDGTQAHTTVEFGNSWALADKPIECEAKACPIHIQNKAWEMCNKVKDETLAPCAKVADIEAFVSRCLENTCTCLEGSKDNITAEEECRCQTLQSFIVDCMQADSSIELTDWRTQHDCPVACESPLVHHDCYRRPCELTCETISDTNVCPKFETVCFPGCYCPPGFVRKGESCVKPSTCRDCECNVLPHLQYVTYDEANFTINGDCVYVMSRDIVENKNDEHKFQVLITNAPCEDKKDKTCVGKVTILYLGHKIHILRDNRRNMLKLIVDSERIDDFSEIQDWAGIRQTKAKHLKILLKSIQVEVSVYFPSLGVSVKAPSHKYGGKLEGLCGDCNRDPDNDFKTPAGKPEKDVEEFGLSWLYDKLPGGQIRENCLPKPEEKCVPLPTDSDPCLQLLDNDKFGLCHPLLDPSMFIEWCKNDICDGTVEQACASIGTYAKECMSSNICIHWHTNLCPAQECPPEQEYKPCGTSCPKTCETIKEKENKCVEIPVDGCFCPEGKVMLNNTCVEERECEVCDEEGHHPGDTWQKDACTACSCIGTTLNCETQHCPAVHTICEDGFDAIKVPSDDKECCDKYICVPAATAGPTCEPPQQLKCNPDQVMKLIKKADGCQKFVCECKPIEECTSLESTTDKPVDDGYEKVINYDGCCPVIKLICKPDLCSKAPSCPTYHTLKKIDIPEKCCPIYNCEAPKKCIIDLGYAASEKGGERSRTELEKQKLPKEVGEIWNDGPCRQCECFGNPSEGYSSVCKITDCPTLIDSPDNEDFLLETEPIIDQCCSKITRVACKDEGNIYKIGEKWPVEGDYCKITECANTTSGLQKLMEITSCDDKCELGYEYVPATPESKQCCGSCKPVACVVEGTIKNVGQEWASADFCSKFICLNINGSIQVQGTVVTCAEIAPELKDEYVYESYPVKGECCKKHKVVACKVGNEIYKVGETWASPDLDKCKKVTCIENSLGELIKQESVETCNKECKKGWKYIESNSSCCGECAPFACVVEDELKQPGENWTSPDTCTLYSCEQLGEQFTVISQQESCPTLDYCPEENIYVKGCCKHCNMTAKDQKICAPVEMKPEDTIGLVRVSKKYNGACTNQVPLIGLTECVGSCHSSTRFNPTTATFEAVCSCCRAIDHKPLITELVCEDGTKFQKQISAPSACSCEGCVAEDRSSVVQIPKKTFTKTGVKTG